ncbi:MULTISPECIES: ABC transporter permease [Hymenobacter]|uniref:ABC transporter permease n=1 Tax=Hymenobacter jejuensis TaxID=2502781 RepID=A0A5B7ZVC4_9BACT|nr:MULTISPECIES: ABC transporter permease [Hymenobacter]MBC6988748.1 ABC transporter permease [Hymenobacter sp. BT491]QDA58940.1 ABC transporter permease [Hymenobacter jejuensis]
MRTLFFLLRKEFRQIFRDKSILAMIFIMPSIQLIIMPLAANYDVKNINLAVVDNDHSSYSRRLIAKVGSSGYFRLAAYAPSFRQGLRLVEDNKADLVLEIPNGFERNLVREGSQQLSLAVDAINGTRASLGGAYLTRIIADFNQGIRLEWQSPPSAATIDIASSNWYNPLGEYRFFMVPAILVLLLTMVGGFLTALNIVREKEIGTIEQINVSPIQKWQFILGKMIPFWILGMIVFTIGLIIARVLYGIIPVGSLPTLYLFAGVYLVALLGFGLLISTYSETQLQAMFVAFFFIMIFILMSGLFTSLDSMPPWARYIAYCSPVTHFIEVVRMIVLKGSGLADVSRQLGYEVIFAVVLNTWAILNYHKTT